jgi:[acyl-carrier-protein] S-malonyltransferase
MTALLREADAETLKRSDIAQPAITLVSLAAWSRLKAHGLVAAGTAGFSLGEYPALACAGVITAEDCFTLVKARGEAMQACCESLADSSGGAPGMAAVTNLAPEKVEDLLAAWRIPDLFAANINSPRQTVISGTQAALEQAKPKFLEAGARRVLPLAVAGPFHSPLMQSAADAFTSVLERTSFSDPAIPLYSNVTGRQIENAAEAKRLALLQITHPVRWTEEEAAVQAAADFEAVIECGPGKALQGLWRDSGSTVPCYLAGTMKDIKEIK